MPMMLQSVKFIFVAKIFCGFLEVLSSLYSIKYMYYQYAHAAAEC